MGSKPCLLLRGICIPVNNIATLSYRLGPCVEMLSDGTWYVQCSARGVGNARAIPIRKTRTIQLVPTLLNDGIRLGDTDMKIRMIKLER
jgi:hypothetical protein